MNTPIYLDNNATTLVAPQVIEAMKQELSAPPSNPSSVHNFGQQAKARLSKARQALASYLKVKTSEILFTSGGTESMNLLIQGYCKAHSQGHIITSDVEHSCVFQTLKKMEEKGWEVSYLPAGIAGAVAPAHIASAIKPTTSLIVLGAVNSETGVKHDISEIAKIAESRKVAFIIDGVALLGKEPIPLSSGITGVGFSAHKFHGPQGVGFVFVRSPFPIKPLIYGGGQEFALRSGTENLPGIIGMAQAVDLLKTEQEAGAKRMKELRDFFESSLKEQADPVHRNGEGERICNVSNLCFDGVDGETLLIQLDLHGVHASLGSACSSGSLEPSRVLLSMGYSKERARSSLRFSLSRYTTKEEIDRAVSIISQIVAQMRELG